MITGLLLILRIRVCQLDHSRVVQRHGCKDALLNGHRQYRITAIINVLPWLMDYNKTNEEKFPSEIK